MKTYCIAQGCYMAAWMGREFGGEWAHIYAWLSLYGRLKIAKAKRLVLKHLDESEQ